MTRDPHIRVLPLHVANKIAAGEVVERPASVLKELMENAIDAGATRIEITVMAGGRKLVAVRDNGCGMSREDALLSLERQATSKIRDVDDIENIDTLGFRGEAIPSIASVSRFTLTTRRPDEDIGTRITVNAGILAEVKECGAPPGTSVEVRDLFCNVPARRKFLRAYATEEANIRSAFTVNALAHPDIGFTLILDGRETYRLPPGATLEERIRDLFGAEFSENLLPVASPASEATTTVHGYVERPSAGPSFRHDQFIFVNGRPASSPPVAYALREAYPRTREESRPAIVIFINLPPNQVDVNVHPAKREVRFRRPAEVREALITAITSTLAPLRSAPAPTPAANDFAIPFSTPIQPTLSPLSSSIPSSPSAPASSPAPVPSPVPASPSTPIAPIPRQSAPVDYLAQPAPAPVPSPSNQLWRWFHYLAQTSTGLVLLETDSGLIALDPRAAQERITYERILDRQQVASQTLLIPETVKLPPADSARIRSFLADLNAVGFAIDEFGRDTWKIDAVPALLAGTAVGELLASIANDIAESGSRRGSNRWRDELIAKAVARSFAGTARQLTPEAAVKLVNELAGTNMPYICPRGRPIMVFRSNQELSRKFGR